MPNCSDANGYMKESVYFPRRIAYEIICRRIYTLCGFYGDATLLQMTKKNEYFDNVLTQVGRPSTSMQGSYFSLQVH
uniref:Uncharacterized protein n=1 Tax=Physcomitrium patens TaxID=3218 RepID=A0A2K1L8S6_PHYPA|nr:hypothetical protein PHYPA_000874 [Physcomitrium patens]